MSRRIRLLVPILALLATVAVVPSAVAAPEVETYPLAAGIVFGQHFTIGPDDALWATAPPNTILRIETRPTVTMKEFRLPDQSAGVSGIATGPDGAIWFTELTTDKIGRITTDGQITEYDLPDGAGPHDMVLGPDGALWFTEFVINKIGRITTDGEITHFDLPPGLGMLPEVAVGPDDAIWFTAPPYRIGKITISGDVSMFDVAPQSIPFGITGGPDGAIWYTEGFGLYGQGRVVRMTTDGQVTRTVDLPWGANPSAIVTGSDCALWYAEIGSNKIGRMTTAGDITHRFDIPVPLNAPSYLDVGPEGGVWFSGHGGPTIGRIFPPSSNCSAGRRTCRQQRNRERSPRCMSLGPVERTPPAR